MAVVVWFSLSRVGELEGGSGEDSRAVGVVAPGEKNSVGWLSATAGWCGNDNDEVKEAGILRSWSSFVIEGVGNVMALQPVPSHQGRGCSMEGN